MRYKLFLLSIFTLIIICSCNKEVTKLNEDINGSWIWESSSSSGGVQQISIDTSATYAITFKNDFSFSNESACMIGGPAEGTYEMKASGGSKILILKAQYAIPDTFKISVGNGHLTLTETINNYSWYHNFNKK